MKIETTIPAELLDLKARLEGWRANRKFLRQPLPAELRQPASAVSRRYSGSLLRSVLKIDPWRLNRSMAKKSPRAVVRKKQVSLKGVALLFTCRMALVARVPRAGLRLN